MKNFTSMNNHGVFNTFIFLLLCSGCGQTDELSTNTEPDIDSEKKAIDSIKAYGGKIARDDTGNVIQVEL